MADPSSTAVQSPAETVESFLYALQDGSRQGRGGFEVHDGRITLWRDFFDFFDIFKATVRGLAGVVVPSLRSTL